MLGDARLTMAKEANDSFDLIIVDAFSSDAVPVHLMTAEALRLYLDKVKPDGIVLLHISNRYLDLDSVLGATVKVLPGVHGFIISDDTADGSYAQSTSTVALFAKTSEALEPFRTFEEHRRVRRRRPEAVDRRLFRHPGAVPEQAPEPLASSVSAQPTGMTAAAAASASCAGATGNTASGVPAAAHTTS